VWTKLNQISGRDRAINAAVHKAIVLGVTYLTSLRNDSSGNVNAGRKLTLLFHFDPLSAILDLTGRGFSKIPQSRRRRQREAEEAVAYVLHAAQS